jgi:xanthine dehydrogenase accessory factor
MNGEVGTLSDSDVIKGKFLLTVVIKGAGDLASGVAHRLWNAGFHIVMLELPQPLVVRRTVSFANAVYQGRADVEGVSARLCSDVGEIHGLWADRLVPVCIDPRGDLIRLLQPDVLVDAVMAKINTGTGRQDAPIVIGLGPGFTAGEDVHAVIETQRSHNLGKAHYTGCAAPNTGNPGEIGGYSLERLLRSPVAGNITPLKEIGQLVEKGETVATVGGVPIVAQLDGLLRGLLYPGLPVEKGLKVGDIDPRGRGTDFMTVSDKARSVAGGCLEAILHLYNLRA